MRSASTFAATLGLCALLPLAGCEQADHPYVFVDLGTAPVGGTFPVVGGAMAEVLNDHPPADGEWAGWKVQTKGSKGTQENIRRLANGQFELGLSNSAISYFAFHGEAGWEDKYQVRAIATLAPLVGVFITRPDTGIETIADLKGKRVVIGPAGAGFEMFVRPILEEHGVPWDSITVLNDPGSVAVDRLGDGAADAIFLGGPAGVRHPSITQAKGTFDVSFVAYDEDARRRLVEKYPSIYRLIVIEHVARDGKPMYAKMDEDVPALIVGNLQLVAHEATPRELVRRITETLCTNRGEFAQKHPIGNALVPANAPRFVGIPFHEGAIDFYRTWPEVKPGIWEETKESEKEK